MLRINLAIILACLTAQAIQAQPNGLHTLEQGAINSLVGVFVDGDTSYVSTSVGVWVVKTNSTTFVPIIDPELGQATRVSIATKSNDEKIYVCAMFSDPDFGVSSGLFQLDNPNKRVAFWTDCEANAIDKNLNAYGVLNDLHAGRFKPDGTIEQLDYATGFSSGAVFDVTQTGKAAGVAFETSTGQTPRASLWIDDQMTVVAPELRGYTPSIRDRHDTGFNIGVELDFQAHVKFGDDELLPLLGTNMAPLIAGNVHVTGSDFAVISGAMEIFVYYDGVTPLKGQVITINHAFFPHVGDEPFVVAFRPASANGRLYIPLRSNTNMSLLIVDDPTGDSILIGDVNCDGAINLLDVQPFVDILSSGEFDAKADINQDRVVDLLDVNPFVLLLTGQ